MAGLGALQGLLAVQRLPRECQRLPVGRQRQPGRGHFGHQAGARRTLVLGTGQPVLQGLVLQAADAPEQVQLPAADADLHGIGFGHLGAPVSLLASLTRERVTLPLASTDGSSAARALDAVLRAFLLHLQHRHAQVAVVLQRQRDHLLQARFEEHLAPGRHRQCRLGSPVAALPNCAGTGASGRW
jgi:hypothetical protein